MSGLGSAALPPLGDDDHCRGPHDAPVVIFYGNYECARCGLAARRLGEARLRVAYRHFPIASKHPRSWAAACAAEAAAAQGRFWEMHDSLFADQGRLEDPHLWQRAGALGLDVGRFDADRRSEQIEARVREQFRAGIRAGVATTPTLFLAGRMHPGPPDPALLRTLEA